MVSAAVLVLAFGGRVAVSRPCGMTDPLAKGKTLRLLYCTPNVAAFVCAFQRMMHSGILMVCQHAFHCLLSARLRRIYWRQRKTALMVQARITSVLRATRLPARNRPFINQLQNPEATAPDVSSPIQSLMSF